jgi:hypothetical protein
VLSETASTAGGRRPSSRHSSNRRVTCPGLAAQRWEAASKEQRQRADGRRAGRGGGKLAWTPGTGFSKCGMFTGQVACLFRCTVRGPLAGGDAGRLPPWRPWRYSAPCSRFPLMAATSQYLPWSSSSIARAIKVHCRRRTAPAPHTTHTHASTVAHNMALLSEQGVSGDAAARRTASCEC